VQIVGNGFLARHLRPIAGKHPDTVAIAAGVSWTGGTSAADFQRESELLAAVAGGCRLSGRTVLFFSTASASVYGADRPGREDDPAVARNPYGEHKLRLERQLRGSGADYLILRLGHLVGPDQPAHQLLPTLVRHLTEGRITIQRAATRDLIAVEDVITVIDALLAGGLRGEIVNVASGTAVPVERIVDQLAARLGVVAERSYQESGTSHLVSIDKLSSLVPQIRSLGFGPDYHRRVLATFVSRTRGPFDGADSH
jgi:NDP-hexose 4-ketoreductase